MNAPASPAGTSKALIKTTGSAMALRCPLSGAYGEAGAAPPHAGLPVRLFRDQPERLRHHQGVVAHRESRIIQGRAHLGRVPEALVPGAPLRHRGVALALAQRMR